MSDPQPTAPLTDAEIEYLRMRTDDARSWGEKTRLAVSNATMLSLLAAFDAWRQRAFDAEASVGVLARENANLGKGIDQERSLRQAAETALQEFRASAVASIDRKREQLNAFAEEIQHLQAALVEERQALTEAVRVLHRADGRLGLLISRGNIHWGYGVGEQQEYSEVIGEIRSTIAMLEETTRV